MLATLDHRALPRGSGRSRGTSREAATPDPPGELRKRSSSRKKRSHTLGVAAFKVHVVMPTPWRKKSEKHQPALPAGACSGGKATPALSPGCSPSPSASNFFPSCSPFAAQAPAPTPRFGALVRNVVAEINHGDQDVAQLQARIDDMWLDEVMLGCDTELYGGVRQAATDLESGSADIDEAQRRASEVVQEDAEGTVALESVHVRMQARGNVHLPGGLAALEDKVRRRRRETCNAVRPYVEKLAEPGGAGQVVRVMDRLLKEAQAEYASVNEMKTAKSEVVLELQDKTVKREWLVRQLDVALGQIEASVLFSGDVAPRDAEPFFVETVRSCPPDDPLRGRALRCLEHLRLWGAAAAQALAVLRPMDGEDTDSGVVCDDLAFGAKAAAGRAVLQGPAVQGPERPSFSPASFSGGVARRLATEFDRESLGEAPPQGPPTARPSDIEIAGLESDEEHAAPALVLDGLESGEEDSSSGETEGRDTASCSGVMSDLGGDEQPDLAAAEPSAAPPQERSRRRLSAAEAPGMDPAQIIDQARGSCGGALLAHGSPVRGACGVGLPEVVGRAREPGAASRPLPPEAL